MFGVRSPLTTPPKLVLTDVKLPRPTPPNPCTDTRVSCADTVEAANSVASRTAANEVIRIVNSSTLAQPMGARVVPECCGVDRSRNVATRPRHVPHGRQWAEPGDSDDLRRAADAGGLSLLGSRSHAAGRRGAERR